MNRVHLVFEQEQELTKLNLKQVINLTVIFSLQPFLIEDAHWFFKILMV